MAVDVFGNEVKPGDLILVSGAGNGYLDVKCVERVMPKSVEITGSYRRSKINADKIAVISLEQASKFFGGRGNSVIDDSRRLKEQYRIND